MFLVTYIIRPRKKRAKDKIHPKRAKSTSRVPRCMILLSYRLKLFVVTVKYFTQKGTFRSPGPVIVISIMQLRLYYFKKVYVRYDEAHTHRRTFNIFLGMSEVMRVAHSASCDPFFFLVTVVDQMVWNPVCCPAKIHCTAVFAL